MAAPECPACRVSAQLTTGADVYPHRRDLANKPIWRCVGCQAYVGCHPGTTTPLGTPAGPELRKARMLLHNQMIDPLWRSAKDRKKARRIVYAFLSANIGIDGSETHTAMFDLERCRLAWRVLAGKNYADIQAWYDKQKEAA